MVTRVSFSDFWTGFRPESFFLPLIRDAVGEAVVVDNRSECDIEVSSVFPRQSKAFEYGSRLLSRTPLGLKAGSSTINPSSRIRAPLSIWYTGENIRPPLDDRDRYWSFDPTSIVGRNRYFPLWWLLFPSLLASDTLAGSTENRIGREISIREVMSERITDVHRRPKFACIFTGWREPMRMRVVQALSTVGQVDVFGKVFGKQIINKADVAHSYRFIICLENDFFPGYVTEKVFDAWACGAIPIWGGIDRERFLNESAIINLAALDSLDSLVERVKRLEGNPNEMIEMAQRPLLNSAPSLDEVTEDLRSLAGSML